MLVYQSVNDLGIVHAWILPEALGIFSEIGGALRICLSFAEHRAPQNFMNHHFHWFSFIFPIQSAILGLYGYTIFIDFHSFSPLKVPFWGYTAIPFSLIFIHFPHPKCHFGAIRLYQFHWFSFIFPIQSAILGLYGYTHTSDMAMWEENLGPLSTVTSSQRSLH